MLLGFGKSKHPSAAPTPFVPSGSFIGFGVESFYGGGATPLVYIPAESFSFDDSSDIEPTKQLLNEFMTDTTGGSTHVSYSGSIQMPLTGSGAGRLLASVLGAAVPTGTSVGAGLLSYSLYPDYKLGQSLAFTSNVADALTNSRVGAMIDTLHINSTFNDVVKSEWSIVGSDVAVATLSDYTPSFIDVNPFNFTDVNVYRDGVQLDGLVSFDFSVSNNLSAFQGLRKSTSPYRFIRGAFDVGLSCTFDLRSSGEWTRLLDNTESFFSLSFGSTGESLTIDIPRVFWKTTSSPGDVNRHSQQTIQANVVKSKTDRPLHMTLVTSVL